MTCSEPGCGSGRIKAHGLCDNHYIRPSRRRVCEGCHLPFVAKSGHGQRFCSQACWIASRPQAVPRPRRSEAKRRQCLNCQTAFARTGRKGSLFYCSELCDEAAQAAARVARCNEVTAHLRVKRRCAEPECERPSRKLGLCCTHYNRRYQPNRSHGPTTLAEWKQQNPEKAAQAARVKRGRRRARKRGLPNEAIDRQVVGERDGWRCGICRRKIDPEKVYPHPLSQSLDHIEPLSEGGHHTYANTRIAHLKCNADRSDRGGNEQLALIG